MHFIATINELSAEIEVVFGVQSSTVHILLNSSKWGEKNVWKEFTRYRSVQIQDTVEEVTDAYISC